LETKFIEGALPEGYRCDFDPYLFNSPQNLTIQSSTGWHSFYALRSEKKVARARVHFHLHEGEALSSFKNPFGSFEFSDSLEPRELFEFMKWTEMKLVERGARRIEITGYPALYNSRCSAILSSFLVNLGYHIKRAELSACIEVSPTSLYQTMSSYEKKKSGEIRKTNLRFAKIPVAKFNQTFEFISSSREEKRQKISVPYAQLKTMSDMFPDKIWLFGLYEKQALAAAAICIQINKAILYNVFSGNSKNYDPLSPMVRLTEGMYEYCQSEKVKVIDLGTSSLNERPNFSLLDFKLFLGANPTEKYTFFKTLA
jgi:hypothetical protein